MSQYDKNTFESLYNDGSASKPFQTNTNRLITSAILRQFAKDASDSFVYNVSGTNIDTYSFESFDWLCVPGVLINGWALSSSGTASGTGNDTYGLDSTNHVVGEISSQTGTTSAGRCTIYKTLAGIALGIGMTFRYRSRCALDALGNGTDRYQAYTGYGDNATGSGDMTNGVYFRYNDSVNSGKWQGVCRIGGVETAIDTGIAADTLYHIFDIQVNSAGTLATFQIDGNTPVTISTNIPGSANKTGILLKIEKSLGTTSRAIHQDWYSHLISKTSAR